MEITELIEQNPWWKDKNNINEDYDIVKWNEKKYKWVPDIIEKINLKHFSFHMITGPRQAGKTTLLKLLIKKLLEKSNPKSLFYFNCENISDYHELQKVFEIYLEFKDNNSIKSSIILLDEITMPKEWYRTIKFLIDKGNLRNDILIITGSSSISVKKEIELFPGRRGHGEDFILYPLSFRGFVKILEPKIIEKIPIINNLEELGKKISNALIFQRELDKHLGDYMDFGGFPLSIANLYKDKEEAKKTYLSWIKNAILKSDRSDLIARQIMKVIIESLQSDISWENISKKIEIKSPKTVSAYVELLKSIFVINILYNLDLGGKKIRFGKNKKIHLRDPLLLEIFEDWCFIRSKNKYSAIAESLVIEHLSRKFPEKIFFWKNNYEIDSIVFDNEKLYGFEVKWAEKSENIEYPNQINQFALITKKEYSKKPLKIPLSVFLVLFDV